jgi:hypothetical protein
MNYKEEVTQEYLKENYWYDPIVGIFVRKTRSSGTKVGKIYGPNSGVNGYVMLTCLGKQYRAHRLAWLYVYGVMPKMDIDHIDGNRANNAINNLREAEKWQNSSNVPVKKSATGKKGVYLTYSGRFKVSYTHRQVKYYLGVFDSLDEAKNAYDAASISLRGEFHRG